MQTCSVSKKCGGCAYQGMTYSEQLSRKQSKVENLLKNFGKVEPIIGMENPYFYRNKVHHVFAKDKKGSVLSGSYEADSHRVVPVEECLLEDQKSQEIIRTICKLIKSFRILIYNEDSGSGLLRHILIRRGFKSHEIMVVLVVVSPIFPSKNNFVKALRKAHPEITTIVLNVNEKSTGMVLGERNITIYGPGFISDTLCGCKFRISPDSFYQVNPAQTEVLYQIAIDFAELSGDETVVDAYCGIGTIALSVASKSKSVIGIELNKHAVQDATINARNNAAVNVKFFQGDAGEFIARMASLKKTADVVFLDPPRSGSTKKFINSLTRMGPKKVVYISCGLDSLYRDLKFFASEGYTIRKIQPVDMFPYTEHVETVVLLSKVNTPKG